MYRKVIIVGLILLSTKAFAFDHDYTYKLVDVDRLSVEHKWYETNRDPYFPDKNDWTTKTDLYWSVRLYRIFWDNDVHMGMDKSQVRTVGWQYILGIHITDWLDLVKDHHSRHVMENTLPQHFPVEDSYGFRLNFIERKK